MLGGLTNSTLRNIGVGMILLTGLISAIYFVDVHNTTGTVDNDVKDSLIALLIVIIVFITVVVYDSKKPKVLIFEFIILGAIFGLSTYIFAEKINTTNDNSNDFYSSLASGFGMVGSLIILVFVMLRYLEKGGSISLSL